MIKIILVHNIKFKCDLYDALSDDLSFWIPLPSIDFKENNSSP